MNTNKLTNSIFEYQARNLLVPVFEENDGRDQIFDSILENDPRVDIDCTSEMEYYFVEIFEV
jgi:hypothetical protein